MVIRTLAFIFALLSLAPMSLAQIRVEISGGVIEATPIAASPFIAENTGASEFNQQIERVVMGDLAGSGLFREIPQSAHISAVTNFDAPIQFADWRAINADILITGSVADRGDQLEVKFRLFNTVTQQALGDGLRFQARKTSWRRIAHKVADTIYTRLTGDGGYFDSRIAYIAEEGPKNARVKRLAVMDYDGANPRYLTEGNEIVLAPRFAPNGQDIVYTSYETGTPKVFLMNVDTQQRRLLDDTPGMTFAPRFSPDGARVVMSINEGTNTDIYLMEVATGAKVRLTSGPAIDTAPSFSPDGSQIVFESDRGGRQQLYVIDVEGGTAERISFGNGSYGTPVWSPRGDLIAFTKISEGRFHVGVMNVDGSNERLLTASFLDEGPTWSPNGRVIMFFRETAGASGAPSIYSVDVTGRNLRQVQTPGFGSDPAWSPLLK